MILRRLILGLCLFFACATPGVAEGLGPVIPKATGDRHPEGNTYMRRWHMEMMKHDRDVTVYQGVRPVGASLDGCFDCHTVRDAAGLPVTAADERHFCRTCHDYAAVRVDCFDCHRSTPDGFKEPRAHASVSRMLEYSRNDGNDFEAVHAYLKTVSKEVEQ